MHQVIFIIQSVFFLLLILICFTVPGLILFKKLQMHLSFWAEVIIATVIGWIIFTILGYLLLVLNLKLLILPIYATIIFLFFRQFRFSKLKVPLLPKHLMILFIPVFALGIAMQLLITFPSGLKINGDILFWSSHAHDASWHIALMNQMEQGWPIQNPAFAGERLVNYHFFSDIAPMYFNYLFRLSFLDLYFRFFPFFYAIVFGFLAYLLGKRITQSFWGGFWSFIFADFAGSFGFIVTFLKDRTIGGESLFWSSQPQSTIGNPPQISALILLLTFLYLFSIYLEKRNKNSLLILLIISGTLIAFKVYAGIALLGSLAICGFWQLVKERRVELFFLFIFSTFVSILLFFPNTTKSSSLLVFEPWWYIRTLVVAPDRLGNIDWELRRQTYIFEGNWKRVIQLELQSFLIFFFGNLGMRFLGLIVILKYFKSFFSKYLNQLILSVAGISFIFPMLFLQKGATGNTSQFFQYYLLIFGLLASEAILLLSKKIKPLLLKSILGCLIIILAIPTQIGLLATFYQRSAFTKIDSYEQQALSFLKNKTPKNSIILTPLFNKYLTINTPIPPIWAWSDTDYIGAFGERSVYLADQEQIANTGYNYQSRKDLEDNLFATSDAKTFDTLIKETNTDYLYFPILQKPNIDLNKTSLRLVFSNELAQIWKTQHTN